MSMTTDSKPSTHAGSVADGLFASGAQPAPGELLLPAAAYTSPAHHEAELTSVFEQSWVHVADLSELKRPGDYVTATIGRTPVLIVHSHDGQIRGFLNVCRHRGATLAEAPGHCKQQLKCPYHAWSYGTDGRLVAVPFREEFVATEDKNLIPVRVGIAEPLVFACLDQDAPEFERWVGKLGPALKLARGAEMVPVAKFEYDVDANWKVAMENALDSYHLPIVHATGEGAHIDLKSAVVEEEEYASSASARFAELLKMLLPPGDHLPEWERQHIRMGSLFPNFIGVLIPGVFFYFRYDPIGVERVRLSVRTFEYGTSSPQAQQLRAAALDVTNQQDIPILERVQRGLRARGVPPFAYASRLEQRIHHFQRLLVRAMSGRKVKLPQVSA